MATKKATSTNKKAPLKKTSTPSVSAKTTVKTISATAPATAGLSSHLESSIQSKTLWRALAAEFIGTFILASVVIAGQGQPIFVLFALVGIVLLTGAVSGAHVNPAMTIGAWATRRIGWLRAVSYIIVQLLGAAVAYFAFSYFLSGANAVSAAAAAYGQAAPALYKAVSLTTPALEHKEWFLFFSELLGTAILAFALATATRTRDRLTGAFAYGLGIFIALMITVTVAGYAAGSAIINPAVALSLQAYQPVVWSYVVYALAPVIGGIVGFIIHDLVRGKSVEQ